MVNSTPCDPCPCANWPVEPEFVLDGSESPHEKRPLTRGRKRYEGSNHLGNVLVVFSDRKLPLNSGSTVTGYQADVHAHSDYYPFGSLMEERTGSAEGYRFGFQGQETDDEVYGSENAVSFKYRVHDARIGRFLSVDPLEGKFPTWGPYTFSGNRVIDAHEIEGLEPDKWERGDCNCSEMSANGETTTYVSNLMTPIQAQGLYENPQDGLITEDNKDSYFMTVYGIEPFDWLLKGEFGNAANRQAVVNAFNQAGQANGVSASWLYTIAAGEGMMYSYKHFYGNDFSVPINSFLAFGLDFMEKEMSGLGLNYSSGGVFNAEFKSDAPLSMSEDADYMVIRDLNGSAFTRYEDADDGPVPIYPVIFRNFGIGVEGASVLYANRYNLAQQQSTHNGWGQLSANQQAYFGYVKVQGQGYNFTSFGFSSQNFLQINSIGRGQSSIPYKAYKRWVTWRWVLYSQTFND